MAKRPFLTSRRGMPPPLPCGCACDMAGGASEEGEEGEPEEGDGRWKRGRRTGRAGADGGEYTVDLPNASGGIATSSIEPTVSSDSLNSYTSPKNGHTSLDCLWGSSEQRTRRSYV